jgi:hypothetical protein
MQQQAVAPEPLDLVPDAGVGDAEFLRDLAVGGASQDPKEERVQESGPLEPVARGKGL